MTKKDKLIARFQKMPSDFHYDEVVKLLKHFGFTQVKLGKSSGSRVKFENQEGIPIRMHKPHPSGIMKKYQLKLIKRDSRTMKYLSYKGYTGTIEYSSEDGLLFGKVIGIRGLLSYEGKTGQALEKDFQSMIDEYLADCKERDIKPEKPFKGSFNVRMPAELHRSAALKAMEMKTSLNNYVTESVRHSLLNEPNGFYKKIKKK